MTDSIDNNQSIIDEAVQQFLDAKMQGQEPDLDEFVKRYPGYENQIRHKIEKIQRIDGLFSGLMEADDSDYSEPVAGHDLIGQTLGDFEILSLIGAGGMGAVFLARQISLDREVALKVISDVSRARGKSLERFKREAKVLAKISHPNIVPVYEVGEHGPYSYFVMEHVQGVSLDKILAGIRNAPSGEKACDVMRKCLETKAGFSENGITNPEGQHGAEIDTDYIVTISKLIISIASALDYAHEKGILHRDVKPSNIIIASDGIAKLVDFGLAKSETQQTVTVTGEFFGTPSYVSPEQIRKPETVDCRSDVYSLAATYYECLTLHAPFEGNTVNETLTQVISKEVIPPKKHCPRLSIDFNTILLHALEKAPDDRYQTACDFSIDIQNVLNFKPITAKRPSITQRTYRMLRRNPLKITVVSITIITVLLAYFVLSQSRNLSKFEEQLQSRKQIVKESPGSALAHYSLGNAYLGSPYHEKAIAEFKSAIKLKPNYAEAYRGLGMAYNKSKNYEASIEAYKEAIKIKPDFNDAYYGLGATYFDAKKYNEAAEAFKYVVEKQPDDIDAIEALGLANERLGRYSEASENYKQSIIINPPKKYKTLGFTYTMSGNYEEAIDSCKKALELDPNNAKLYSNLGFAYTLSGRYEDAIKSCLQAISIDSESADAYYWLGYAYNDMGNYEEAIETYQKVLKIDSQYADAYCGLGNIYAVLNEYEDAISFYNKALKIEPNPNDDITYNQLGNAYLKLERNTEAIDSFRNSIRINNNWKVPYQNLGNTYLNLGKYEEAIKCYKQAIAIDPNFAVAYGELGHACLELDRYVEAVTAYKQAIVIDPNCARAHYGIGTCYSALGQSEKAMIAYEKAITTGPNDVFVLDQVGVAYVELDQNAKAVPLFQKAIRIDPNDVEVLANLGFTYGKLRQYDKEIETLEQCIRLKSDYAHAYYRLAYLYATCPNEQFRDGRKAIELAEAACKLTDYKRGSYLSTLAAAYAENGDFDKAIKYQEKAIGLADSNVRAEYTKRLEAYKANKPWRE